MNEERNVSVEQLLKRYAWKTEPVGSRVTCNPAPTDTDRDTLVLIMASQAEDFMAELESAGCEVELGDGYAADALNSGQSGRFQSYRLGEDNLIVTIDEKFYRRFVAATTVAKRLNLMDKADRIALFQAVLYGNACEQVKP